MRKVKQKVPTISGSSPADSKDIKDALEKREA